MSEGGPGLQHQPGVHRRLLTEITALLATPPRSKGVTMEMKTKAEHDMLLARLRDTLTSRTEAAIKSRVELRDAVCRYVEAEQTRGTSLRTIIGSVKEILARAEEGATAATAELAQQLIDWCTHFHGKRVASAGEVT